MRPNKIDDKHGPHCRGHIITSSGEVVFCAEPASLADHEHLYERGGFSLADAREANASAYDPQAMLHKAAEIQAQIEREDGLVEEPDLERLTVRALQMSAHASQLKALVAFTSMGPSPDASGDERRLRESAMHALHRAARRVIADLNDELADEDVAGK